MTVLALLVLLAFAGPAAAQKAPPGQRGIGVDEHPGRRLPLTHKFIDERGHEVPLGRFFRSDDARPVLVVPGYFRCKMLCGVLAPRLLANLRDVDGWTPGEDYRVLLISIDPREGPKDAAARRAQALDGDATGWSLLTGSKESVDAFAGALGFQYRYDPTSDQFAHAAIVVAVAPDGTIARYVYGVNPNPDTLGVVLAAARDKQSASSLQQVLVRCFLFTPSLRKHASLIASALRAGAVAILVGLALVFVFAARRAARTEGEAS